MYKNLRTVIGGCLEKEKIQSEQETFQQKNSVFNSSVFS